MPKAIQPRTIQLTQQGLDELKAELDELNNVKLPAVIKRVAEARSHGDLSENAEYQNAREEQQFLEARIGEIEDIISKAQVVKNASGHAKVGMGSTVILSLATKKGKTFTYMIVGEFQAEPAEGKISSDSPIGRALMGKKKGDKATVAAPAGNIEYLIEDIK
jgi:transcription elongation factor GreA